MGKLLVHHAMFDALITTKVVSNYVHCHFEYIPLVGKCATESGHSHKGATKYSTWIAWKVFQSGISSMNLSNEGTIHSVQSNNIVAATAAVVVAFVVVQTPVDHYLHIWFYGIIVYIVKWT